MVMFIKICYYIDGINIDIIFSFGMVGVLYSRCGVQMSDNSMMICIWRHIYSEDRQMVSRFYERLNVLSDDSCVWWCTHM